MLPTCPHCYLEAKRANIRPSLVRFGSFTRKSDDRFVQRYKCTFCGKGCSDATFDPCFQQHKRFLNPIMRKMFAIGVCQRDMARELPVNRKTVARKLLFLASEGRLEHNKQNKISQCIEVMEFDDMETFEHTKMKPLSIVVAVEEKTRRILGVEVARMPCKGRLAKRSVEKYGPRIDERPAARQLLFARIQPLLKPGALIKSDMNPHYGHEVKAFFPTAEHRVFKGRRGCVVGQGELKAGGYDPLFTLNHTCAMVRAKMSRMFRRTWNTTKCPHRLAAHLAVFISHHHEKLARSQKRTVKPPEIIKNSA